MKTKPTKKEAENNIEKFFSRKEFSAKEVRKIKRLAMKFNIKLGKYRREFCKKCLDKLRGKNKVSKNYKTVKCERCRFVNRIKIS